MTFSSTAALACLLLLLTRPDGAAADEIQRDLSGVSAIEIDGEAARVALTTGGGPAEVRLAARRSGWFARWTSSWFFNECRSESRMRVEGSVLHVEVAGPSAFDVSDCTVELSARLPEGVMVRIGLDAVDARLDGRFGRVDIGTRAGNVVLAGTVEEAELGGTALRARLDLAGAPAPRRVSLAAGSLDAELALPADVRLGWRVDAKAALVDTIRPNAPEAPTQLSVAGDYVRLKLR